MIINNALKSLLILLVCLSCFVIFNTLYSVNHLLRPVRVGNVTRKISQKYMLPSLNPAENSSSLVPIITTTVKASINASIAKTTNAPGPMTKKNQPRQISCVNCFVHNFKYLIQNTDICATSGSESIDLLILILTVHKNKRHRQNIRNSWVSYAKNNTGKIRYAFLLGRTRNEQSMDSVYAESKIHKDILMEDFMDAYSNLTYKTIMAMKWTSLHCSNTKFLMKTDDDMWVNVPQLLILLKVKSSELQHAVGGACQKEARPIRDPTSKWFASILSYPQAEYPGFCSGTGYVTSVAMAKKLYEISPNIPFFHLEDVYISLCIKKLQMRLVSLPGFFSSKNTLKPCELRSSKIITVHQVPTHLLHTIMEAKC